jgi:hypothetical protein
LLTGRARDLRSSDALSPGGEADDRRDPDMCLLLAEQNVWLSPQRTVQEREIETRYGTLSNKLLLINALLPT